jgi:hypothetical protein
VGIAIVLVAWSAIVGLSMSSATVEQERLFSEFTAETRGQVHASAQALSQLDSVHQDMHLLAGDGRGGERGLAQLLMMPP